jgi:hypothetical protein
VGTLELLFAFKVNQAQAVLDFFATRGTKVVVPIFDNQKEIVSNIFSDLLVTR